MTNSSIVLLMCVALTGILGQCTPMVLYNWEYMEPREALGWSMIFGMIAATLLIIYFALIFLKKD